MTTQTKILLAVVYAVCAVCAASGLAGTAGAQTIENRIVHSFTEPIEKSVAASAETGIVAVAHVKEGDRVRTGQPIASINHNVLKESWAIAVARSEATARLDAAQAQMQLLETQLQAVSSLLNDGHTNQFEVQQKSSEFQEARAEYRAAADELKLAALEVKRIRAQIGDRIIKSPIDGIVTEIHKQLGENLSQSEPQYATIVRVDKLKVRFYLDATTLRNASVGDRIALSVGAERTTTEGTVSFVSPVIDPDSGLGRLDVEIENGNGQLQSGIACFWESNQSVASKRTPALR